MDLKIVPMTNETWPALEALFGPHGAYGGCWCMFFRQNNKAWLATGGAERKALLQELAGHKLAPGLMAIDGEQPVGWISLGPRSDFVRLEKSRVAKPVDEQPVWSVVCFFVHKEYRRLGVTVDLLKGGIQYARQNGAAIVEGYPVDAPGEKADPYVYTGLASAFRQAGFVEVARRTENRPIMRFYLESK